MDFFTSKETNIAFKEFEKHISAGLYKQFDVNSTHLRKGEEILRLCKAPLRTLDAIHLGIVRTEKVEFASNDLTLLKAAKEFNISTVEI